MAKSPCSHCRGPSLNPLSGNQISHNATKNSHAETKRSHLSLTAGAAQKKKDKHKYKSTPVFFLHFKVSLYACHLYVVVLRKSLQDGGGWAGVSDFLSVVCEVKTVFMLMLRHSLSLISQVYSGVFQRLPDLCNSWKLNEVYTRIQVLLNLSLNEICKQIKPCHSSH